MPLTLHYVLWTPPTLVLFLAVALGTWNPMPRVAGTLRRLGEPGGRRVLLLLALVLAGAILECLLEPALGRWLGAGLTPRIAQLEGDLVERIQRPVPDSWIPVLTWFYLFGFGAAQLLPFFVWAPSGNDGVIRRYCFAFGACALLALPFYLFVPVHEVAWSGYSEAVALMDRIWPGVSEEIRMGSGVDNCFPSLHVGCTALMWLVARSHGPKGYARFCLFVALATSWVVMALGIHWFTDVVTGWLHAAAALCLGGWLQRKYA